MGIILHQAHVQVLHLGPMDEEDGQPHGVYDQLLLVLLLLMVLLIVPIFERAEPVHYMKVFLVVVKHAGLVPVIVPHHRIWTELLLLAEHEPKTKLYEPIQMSL